MNVFEKRLADILTRGWWRILLRGLAGIAFGLLTWSRPDLSLSFLVVLFAVYAIADGILAIWTALSGRGLDGRWWVLFLGGLLGIGVGFMTLVAPGITTVALLLYIAAWAIGKGVLEIVSAIHLRQEIHGEWWLILAGLASVAFGVLLVARPGVGALAVLSLIALYSIVFGTLLVFLALKARSFRKRLALT